MANTGKCVQVKTPSGWKYVFCKNANTGKPVTTDSKTKALRGVDALSYMKKCCGNDDFRLEPTTTKTKKK